MTEIDIAYLAGLFDGEGSVCFGFTKNSSQSNKKYGRLIVNIAQKDRMILDWVRESLGYGAVHWNGVSCHQYRAVKASARKFLALIRPYVKIKGLVIDEKLALDRQYVKPKSMLV